MNKEIEQLNIGKETVTEINVAVSDGVMRVAYVVDGKDVMTETLKKEGVEKMTDIEVETIINKELTANIIK
jgi:hypothetical protein